MSSLVDNLIAYRFLTLLVKPFPETDAYKLGIIDENGNNLIKARDLKTSEQKNAYNYLHRLTFNLKRLLNKLPGGESKLKNIVAAMFLLKECYNSRTYQIDEKDLQRIIDLLEDGVILAEEQLMVEDFFLAEDMAANVTGTMVSTDQPVIHRRRKFAKFIVNDEVYSKFAKGKTKFRRWSEYLNMEDEGQQAIYNFAKKNPKGIIILQNGTHTKAIRFNRNGGGSWSKVKRQGRVVAEVT